MKHSSRRTYFKPSVSIINIEIADILGSSTGIIDFNPDWVFSDDEEVGL